MDENNTSALAENETHHLTASGDLGPSTKRYTSSELWRRLHHVSPFASNVGLTVLTNGLIALAGLVTGPVCARLLGPTGRGELAAIQNLFWVVAILAMLGMPEASLYFIAQRKNESKRVLASSVALVLALSPLFVIAAYPIVPHLLAAQSANVISTASWCLVGIPLYTITIIPLFALRGRNDLLHWNMLRILPTMGWLALLLFAPRALATSPRWLIWGYLGALAVVAVPTWWVTGRQLEGRYLPDAKLWPPMLRYGLPLAGAAIPYHLNLRLDQMLMAAFLPASSLGLYVVGVAWSGAVTPLLLAIGTVLFPRVASVDIANRETLLAQGVRLSVAAAAGLAVVISVLTPWMLPLLFGHAFHASVEVGIVLVVAAAISGVNVVMEEGLRGLEATMSVFWAESAGLAVTLLSLLVLLRPLGILGAGIASILGYLATLLVLIGGVRERTGLRHADILLPQRRDLQLIASKVKLAKSAIMVEP